MTGWLLSSVPGLLHLGGDRGVGHACPGVGCPSQGALLPSVMGGLIGKLMGELMGAPAPPCTPESCAAADASSADQM